MGGDAEAPRVHDSDQEDEGALATLRGLIAQVKDFGKGNDFDAEEGARLVTTVVSNIDRFSSTTYVRAVGLEVGTEPGRVRGCCWSIYTKTLSVIIRTGW